MLLENSAMRETGKKWYVKKKWFILKTVRSTTSEYVQRPRLGMSEN